jgi:hypothetical protein
MRAQERGEAEHLFPVDPAKVRTGEIPLKDVPYMQRGGSWTNSDLTGKGKGWMNTGFGMYAFNDGKAKTAKANKFDKMYNPGSKRDGFSVGIFGEAGALDWTGQGEAAGEEVLRPLLGSSRDSFRDGTTVYTKSLFYHITTPAVLGELRVDGVGADNTASPPYSSHPSGREARDERALGRHGPRRFDRAPAAGRHQRHRRATRAGSPPPRPAPASRPTAPEPRRHPSPPRPPQSSSPRRSRRSLPPSPLLWVP